VILRFTAPTVCPPGTIAGLLRESYALLIRIEPDPWQAEIPAWDQFDADVVAMPASIGACTALSWVGEELVGLLSYDPRQAPDLGIIGHNCVLPKHRGQGHGRAQIEEVLRRLEERRIRTARVTTCQHPFFEPARRMYESVGFTEIGREEHASDPRKRVIHYEFGLTREGS